MRTIDKLVASCDEQDRVAEQRDRERERLAGKISFLKNEIGACESERKILLRDAEKIVADAHAEASKKRATAGEVLANTAKLTKKLADAEAELRRIDGTKRTSVAVIPSLLGLGR